MLINLSVQQLRQAANLKEQIENLIKELGAILGATGISAPSKPAKPVKKGGMSAAGRARIVAAQKLRWAKINAAKAKAAPKAGVKAAVKPAKKFTMSAAAKAKISAAAKLRWAKIRAAKKK